MPDARDAVAQTWKAIGWPLPPRNPADYERLQGAMTTYLERLFPKIAHNECAEIAGETLVRFMAPIYAGRDRGEHPAPEDLVRALEDAALDRPAASPGLSDGDDTQVTTLAFGVDPGRVCCGLASLADQGAALEFRIVTRYLDLVDRDRTRPPRSAEVLAGIAPDNGVTERTVRDVLLDFRRRVTAEAFDDHT